MSKSDFEKNMKNVRLEIDKVDRELLPLIVRRMNISEKVAEIKRAEGVPVLDESREQIIIDNVRAKSGMYADATEEVYRAIMKASRSIQNDSLRRSDIIKVETDEQIHTLVEMAIPIWHETYDTITSKGQTEYMLEKFQSFSSVKNQIEEVGYHYYFVIHEDKPAAFIGFLPHHKKESELFLSKVYVAVGKAGNGLASKAINFVIDIAQSIGTDKIWLTVNKNNTHAINVYEHFGFKVTDEVETDIGNGYIMDDYIMTLKLDK